MHELICRIQNLLIDKCQFCSCNFATAKTEKLLFKCCLCGQNVHTSCLQNLLGNKFDNEMTATDVKLLINPLNISSLHFCDFIFYESCAAAILYFPALLRTVLTVLLRIILLYTIMYWKLLLCFIKWIMNITPLHFDKVFRNSCLHNNSLLG